MLGILVFRKVLPYIGQFAFQRTVNYLKYRRDILGYLLHSVTPQNTRTLNIKTVELKTHMFKVIEKF